MDENIERRSRSRPLTRQSNSSMHQLTAVPLLEFDQQGDIRLVRQNPTPKARSTCDCLRARNVLHQLSLILFVLLYLIFGGFLFAYIESGRFHRQDIERREMIRQTFDTIRLHAADLLNEELNENFEHAYRQWRWHNDPAANYIRLNADRVILFERKTESELKNLSLRLTKRRVIVDRYAYKWTYSTAILYAATLVTTIGYGNITPKTVLGKFCTVIYALIGILLVLSWLKSVGESLALSVTVYCRRMERFVNRRLYGDRRYRADSAYLYRKLPIWIPLTLLFAYLLLGSLLFTLWEDWSYIDGAYFSFITFTTIGFGDLVPGERTLDHRNGRSLLCAMYLIFGVMLTAMSFEIIQEDIAQLKARLLRRLGMDRSPLQISASSS